MLRVFAACALLASVVHGVRITATSGSDSTMVPGQSGADVVERTVEVIKTACLFGDDKLFMRRLAYVESFDGADKDAYRANYHGGIWQVDEAMFNKLKESVSRQKLSQYTKLFKSTLGVDWEKTKWEDCRKPLVSALSARLYLQLKIDSAKKDIPREISDQGPFWSKYYRDGADANIFINAANKLNQGCKQIYGVDIVFVLDSSGSVGKSNYEKKMLTFVRDVVKSFDVSSNHTRVGMVTYSTRVYLDFYLNAHKTNTAVDNAIRTKKYRSGGTNTHLALNYVYKTMFDERNGARPLSEGVPRVLVFLTDGQSNKPKDTEREAKELHKHKLSVFAVGVGKNVKKNELEKIASAPECLHLFMLDDFNEVDSLKYAIMKGTCDAPVIVSPGNNGTEVDGKVPGGGDQNCKIMVPSGGTTIQINAVSGAVKFYVSTTTYPSAAYYDAMVTAVPGIPAVVYLPKPATTEAEGIVFCNIKGDNKKDSDVEVGIRPGDQDHCKGHKCENNGKCVDNLKDGYSCLCAAGFEGTHCEKKIIEDPCKKNPCFKGTCLSSKDGKSFTCACDAGWLGKLCRDPSDECVRNPCQHGNCTAWGKHYECCCELGWGGVNCDKPINECKPNPCRHGNCRDQVGKYTCECEDGYYGVHCENEIDECDSNPCIRGECRNLVNKYECTCPIGWTGVNCEINIDDCKPNNPCVHGSCVDRVNAYICKCHPGWKGDKCDINIDDCEKKPCIHGKCADGINSYKCTCDPGWKGDNCDVDLDECLSSPCKHGTCADKVNGFVCHCKPGFTGPLCDTEINECDSNPCQNGGSCNDEVNGYHCVCAPGFEGAHCEINIDDCKSNPCEHGTCTDRTNDYLCTCQPGYTGKNCDCRIDYCVPNPCKNGVCINGVGDYTCNCLVGWMGKNCDTGIKTTPRPPLAGHDCKHRNPCTQQAREAGKYYFPHVKAYKFVQCDAFGKCFEMNCPPNLHWDVHDLTCKP